MKGWRGFVGAMVVVAGLGSATPVHAAYLEDAGWGALTVFTNVIYMPAKLVYATLGGITGGLAFALTGGDTQTAETVWVTTMGGTYVVTPRMLQGEDPIAFSGSPGNENTANGDQGQDGGLQEHPLGDS